MYQLRDYQKDAVQAVYQHLREKDNNPCAVLPTGCHAKGHPILMFDGTVKAVEDVVVGDVLMGADSTPRHVLALCRGRDMMYRITPKRGESFVVNGAHVLSLVQTNTHNNSHWLCDRLGGTISNVSLDDWQRKSKYWKHIHKLYRTKVGFQHGDALPMPPYILGILLGDGSIIRSVELTTADDEIAAVFKDYANTMNCDVRVSWNGSMAHTYHAVQPKVWGENPITRILRSLGLFGHKAEDKFIPFNYRVASEKDRYELLAGLMDTDGHLNDGKNLDYITKSRRLAEDIVFLARSLGFFVSWRPKECYAQTGNGGFYYRLTISGHLDRIPFRRHRHNPPPRRMKKDVCRTGFIVEPVGIGDFYGFTLDGDHLYVDGNFMVHHNSGKSVVIAQIAKDAATVWNGRVMILAHVKELVEQNAGKLKSICPELPIGIYSAGLESRDVEQPVIVAGIQSVYNKIDAFKQAPNLIIVDEAHTIPEEGLGRYRTFLLAAKEKNPHVRLVGFTATPYRTQGGLICKPENLLNEVCYEIGVKELINRGYISNITAKAGKYSPDTDGLHIRAGEFVAEDVEKLMGEDGLVNSACREIVELTKDRQACLIFCTSVAHCKKVAAMIAKLSGQECAIVTGDTPAQEREETIRRLRGETVKEDFFSEKPPLKYCCNVSVLTTGTDIPRLDTIALLRPTNSPGLLVQMVGRGFRLSPETAKKECLVLDYGRNIERHGPIDMIKVREPGQGGSREPLAKVCPQCQTIVNLPVMLCPECGYQWPRKEPERKAHDGTAARVGILSGEVTTEKFPVMLTSYQVWEKRGAPPGSPKTVRVTYEVDYLHSFSEWLCPEHTGYARRKFERWWREHAHPDCPPPRTAEEVCEDEFTGFLREVKEITVRFVSGEKYPEVTGCELGEFPLVESGESTHGEGDSYEDFDDLPF